MKSAAIICEFNPLHNGHEYILSRMRERSDAVVCIMSGNFTQRSEAAIYDKYDRAKCAVAVGADLVVSLPFPWSSASGEYFAAAGVKIAEGLGCDELYFGVNSDFDELLPTARFLRSPEFSKTMREASRCSEHRSDGPRAVLEAVLKQNGLKPPQGENDVLALEYYRAAQKIKLVPIMRLPGGVSVLSASEIRKLILSGEAEKVRSAVPRAVLEIVEALRATAPDSLAELERVYLRLADRSGFSDIEAAGGGVGERLLNAARNSSSGEEMLAMARSKKYTDSRLRRAALFTLAQVKRGAVAEPPCFTELLAASEVGLRFLASVKKSREISMLTKAADHKKLAIDAARQYNMTMRSDELYATVRGLPCAGHYMTRSPIIIK